MQKRVRTLLVPYLLTNALCFTFYVALNLIALKVSAIDNVVNFKVFNWFGEGILAVLGHIFFDPIAFQMWFVRDLMVIVAVSPVIYLLFCYGLRHRLIVPTILTIMFALMVADMRIYCFDAAFWFMTGGWLAISRVNVSHRLPLWVWILCLAVYLAIVTMKCVGLTATYLQPFMIACGVVGIWGLYDHIAHERCLMSNAKVAGLCGYTFFIYLIHEPFLNIFKKLPLLVNRSEPMLIACYLLIPPLFCLAAIGGGKLLKHSVLKVYNIFTGGR